MENRSEIFKKAVIQLPHISERYTKSVKSDILKFKNNFQSRSSKSPIQGRLNPNSDSSGYSPNRTPTFEIRNDFSIVKEKKLQEIESELSIQESRYSDLNILYNIEHLFYSYTAYLEGVTQCILSHVYKSCLSRAKNGFITVFRKMLPKLKHETVQKKDEMSQTLMSINPQQDSQILSKLGDIVKEEIAGTEKLEKYIRKTFIIDMRKPRSTNSTVQTDHRILPSGVISYEFKSYDELEQELEETKKKNKELIQEKQIMEKKYEYSDNTDKLIYRNKVLESIVVKIRHSALLEPHEFGVLEDI